jgi:hypothetical protein
MGLADFVLSGYNEVVVHNHSIAITIADAGAAQTDTITIDGVACSFTSDATPTKAEVCTGLMAAIAASTVAGKFIVTNTGSALYSILLRPAGTSDPVVSVSANLADTTSVGMPIVGAVADLMNWGTSYDDEQITVDGLKSLTVAKVKPAGTTETKVLIQLDTAAIRFRVGANATAAIGVQVSVGDYISLPITRDAWVSFTMFPVSATATANVQYFYR